jgi:hypothetical protein
MVTFLPGRRPAWSCARVALGTISVEVTGALAECGRAGIGAGSRCSPRTCA